MEHTDLAHVEACPLCGHRHFTAFAHVPDHSVSKQTFNVVDCAACGFRITSPRPTPGTIGQYYQSEDYISHTNTERGLVAKLYQRARRLALRGKLRLIGRYHGSGRVLDVGCGTGEFLALLKQEHYLVHGVEPDLRAREQAIANHSLQVLPNLSQVEAREQFQVITLWHVLEHLHDLRGSMKQLFARTAEEGVLIIAVPDRDSWDASHFGTDWAAYDVPRHLWHFRRSDVHRLLQEHGFELVDTKRMPLDAFYIAILSERYRGRPLPLALCLALIKGSWSNLISWTSGRSTSSSLFIARKPSL